MKNLGLAFRTLVRILRDDAFAEHIQSLSERPPEEVSKLPEPKPPVRNDAVALIALLQREGRLVDFLQEPIDDYSDAQIGAAVREVHKGSAVVLEQALGLEPIRQESEDSPVSVPEGFEAGEYKLTGNLVGEPPYEGVLRHHGWRATRCELPTWTGSERAASVVAPAEVEMS